MSRVSARPALALAILAGLLATALLLGRGGDAYEITIEFENASQLVPGNEVLAADVPIGSVERIELSEQNQALISISIDSEHAPLPEGVRATVRSGSLATVAGRSIVLDYPQVDERTASIPDGGTLTSSSTVSEVDVDAILNALDEPTTDDLKRVLAGLQRSLAGVGEQANQGAELLNPVLSTSRRVVGELNRGERDLEQLIVDGSILTGTLADRAPEFAELLANLDGTLGAIGSRRSELTAAIDDLPPFLRRANTTLVNIRVAADDLEPLLVASLPVAERAGPFFTEFRAAAADAVPTIRDLDAIVRRPGRGNDLTELVRSLPPVAEVGVGRGAPSCGDDSSSDYAAAADDDFSQGALGELICTARNSLPILSFFRPYSPELVGWFDDFSTSGTIDANGGVGRIAGTFNTFSFSPSSGLPELLSPIDPVDLYGVGGGVPIIDVGNTRRCPGSLERDPGDGSVPMLDGGDLNCDPSQGPTGP